VAGLRRAVDLRPSYLEAWNELGYALRNQGRYADSLNAYEEALRLRPSRRISVSEPPAGFVLDGYRAAAASSMRTSWAVTGTPMRRARKDSTRP